MNAPFQAAARLSAQRILQRGLLTGKWSVASFNGRRARTDLVLPTWDFLQANPQFEDPNYRDDNAYRANHWPYVEGKPAMDSF